MRTPMAVVILCLASAAACAPAPSPSVIPTGTPFSSPTEGPNIGPDYGYGYYPDAGVDGGQLVLGDWRTATAFQPFYAMSPADENVVRATQARLLTLSYDYQYAPELAASIPTVDDGDVKVPGENGDAMTVIWTLKPHLAWSDGRPLTCDDFRYTWAWVRDPANHGLANDTAGYDQITSVECPTPTEIVDHFGSIYEGYLSLGAVLPRHYLEQFPMAAQVKGAGWTPEELPSVPTSGAFRFGSSRSGPAGHVGPESELPRPERQCHVPRLARRALVPGSVLTHLRIRRGRGRRGDGPHGVRRARSARLGNPDTSISLIPTLEYQALRLNWADGSKVDPITGVGGCSRNPAVKHRGVGCPVSDPAFRAAMASAIDIDKMIAQVEAGLVVRANSNQVPDAYYYDATVVPPPFAPDTAASILDAAGWTMGPDGVRVRNGLRAEIEICTSRQPDLSAELAFVIAELKAVGIKAIATTVPPTDLLEGFDQASIATPCAVSHGNFDVAMEPLQGSFDPISLLARYDSSRFEPNGENDARVANPQLDAALEAVSGTVDFVAVKRAMSTFQHVYVDKTVEIPLYFLLQGELIDGHVGNFFSNPVAGTLWNAVDWYRKP